MYRSGAEKKIRQYLVDSNYVDAVIQLPENLFFGTTIATCIMVLKKSKADTQTVFIDASKECVKVTNSNKLTPENIENILKLYTDRVDFPHTVLFDNAICLSRSLSNNSLFLGRDKHVLEVKGETAKECHTVTEVLYIVKELSCASNSADLEYIFNDSLERLFPKKLVDITNLIGDKIVEHKASNRGLYNITLRLSIHNSCIGHHYLDRLMDIYTPIVVSDIGLLCTIENGGDTFLVNNLLLKLLLLRSQAAELRNVVKPEHHILRRHGNRLTTCRVEDIM